VRSRFGDEPKSGRIRNFYIYNYFNTTPRRKNVSTTSIEIIHDSSDALGLLSGGDISELHCACFVNLKVSLIL
jgi:hypothetical protein